MECIRSKEGPLKGMFNGDRHYKVEVKPGVNIGSYHLIDGVKVTVRYAGQKITCGRCHLSSDNCKGGGIAKRCEAQGGLKTEFSDYIKSLWQDLGYSSENDEIDAADDMIEKSDNFTPMKVQSFPVEKFAGVRIKQFPRDIDQGDIIEYLCHNGLPEDKKESVQINSNGTVIIKDLDHYIVEFLINSIHGKIKYGRKLYCNGVVPLTPAKSDNNSAEVTPVSNLSTLESTAPITEPVSQSSQPVLERGIPSILEPVSQYVPILNQETSIDDLVRRHSLSLVNRTPPRGSLAENLLLSKPKTNLEKTASMIDEIRSMTDRLSDFGSCISSDESSNHDTGFSAVEGRRHKSKSKRKSQQSPEQSVLLKRPNLKQ